MPAPSNSTICDDGNNGARRRYPFAPTSPVLNKVSGRNASLAVSSKDEALRSLDAFNRSTSSDESIRLCALSRTASGKMRTCDAAYRCVFCSRYRLAERRADLVSALSVAEDVAFLTVTKMKRTGEVASEWADLNHVLAKFTDRGTWARFKNQHGISGYSVTVEHTLTSDGWHVHGHFLFTFSRHIGQQAQNTLRTATQARWAASAIAVGLTADPERQSLRMVPTDERLTIARYVTKQDLAYRSRTPGTRYPADLLAEASRGDVDAMDEWQQYTEAAKGKALVRQYGSTRGTK